MHKMLVVAQREYAAAVKTKAFLISLFLMPLLMGGGALVQLVMKDQVDIQEKRFAMVDRTPGERLVAKLQAAAKERNAEQIFDRDSKEQIRPEFAVEKAAPSDDSSAAIAEQRFELSERVRRGELFGFIDAGPEVGEVSPAPGRAEDRHAIRYQSNSPTYDDFQNWARPILEQAVQESRFQAAGLPGDTVRAVMQSVPLHVKGLSQKNVATGAVDEAKDENVAVSVIVPASLMIMMFMLILIGATPAMQGVVEEKMQRISEMMLGSIRPFQLMMGKLIGLMGVSLTLAAIYLAAAYWAARHYGFADLVSPQLMAWFIAYLILAILMYGAMFIAVGAACSDIRETQTMLWPVMLLAMLPLFVWINVAKEPSSTFSIAASFLPTATPMLMLMRVAVPPGVAWWQPALGLALMLATTLVFVYAAGRIFRVGILMQGKSASPRELVRWVVRG